MPLITSLDGNDNNRHQANDNHAEQPKFSTETLQVHNNINTQDRSKDSNALSMDVIEAQGMIFPMPCASIASKTSNDNQST